MRPSTRNIRAAALAFIAIVFGGTLIAEPPRPKISEDRELTDLDLSAWDCIDHPEGTAKTPDGVERNKVKNRSAVEFNGMRIEAMDTATFLNHVAALDREIKGKHRTVLNPPQRQELDRLEKQVVSLTAWLVVAYVGPPETSNCANGDFHDWHM